MKPDCASMRAFSARISTFSTIGNWVISYLHCEVSTFPSKCIHFNRKILIYFLKDIQFSNKRLPTNDENYIDKPLLFLFKG